MIDDFFKWLETCDSGNVGLSCLMLVILGFVALMSIYHSLPCPWGPHDWQEIGEPARIEVNAGTLKIYNRVCLSCKKIDLQADPYLQADKLAAERAKSRQQQAESIIREDGYRKMGR